MSSLKLQLVISHIEEKAFVVQNYLAGPSILPRNDPFRLSLKRNIVPVMKAASKFIFDSGSDRNKATRDAILDTASNMVDAGLFHLPHSTVWIEDPFENENLQPNQWHFYLCTEE